MKNNKDILLKKENNIIPAYECSICGYLYDIESAKKTKEGKIIRFTNLPDDFICPNCGVKKEFFREVDSDRTPDKIKT